VRVSRRPINGRGTQRLSNERRARTALSGVGP